MTSTSNSDTNSISSSDDSYDDADDGSIQRPKRYKLMFNPDFEEHSISDLTRRRWKAAVVPDRNCNQNNLNTSSRMEDHVFIDYSPSSPPTSASSEHVGNFDEFNEVLDSTSEDENVNVIENEANITNASDDDYFHAYASSLESEDEPISEDDDEYDPDDPNNDLLFDRIMFPQANLKVRDVVVLIKAVSLKLSLPDEGKIILGDMIKVLAGKEYSDVSLSKYMINKCISSQEEHVTCHYYCNNCSESILLSVNMKEIIKKKNILCKKCQQQQIITSTSSNYFLSLDLKHEINQLLTNERLKNDFLSNLLERKNNFNDGNINDIHDGEIYHNIVANTNLESDDEYVATFNISTDGAPLSKSGKKGFWPVQIMFNDFSPKIRFKNILLCGLLLTEKEPDSKILNLYVDTVFVDQIQALSTEGINVLTDTREQILIRFFTHGCVVDAIARRILQNRMQFNAYYGCSWCYQFGKYITEVKGVRYVASQNSELRTNDSHRRDVEFRASSNVQSYNGVKGECCLSKLPFFDMVWSFPYEYLHSLLLGDTLTMWNEWKKGSSEFKIRPAEVEFIEKRFLKITPTREIHRLPRSGIIKGLAKPKGSELKSWLLYFSLPCLNGVLNEEALQHYSILVDKAYKVLSTKIPRANLAEYENDLLEFVINYEFHYGESCMLFNIHLILHIIQSIRKTGPLIYNSAFPFESNIYHLKKLVSGPKGMDKQIARKFLQKLIFTSGNVEIFSPNKEVKSFCFHLYSSSKLTKAFRHGEDVVFCGKGAVKNINGLGNKLVYKKCIFNGSVYTCETYTQAKKTNDGIVKLKSGEFGKIVKIIDNDGNCYLQVRIFKLFADLPFPPVTHLRRIESEPENNYRVVPITEVDCKALLVNARNGRYLSTIVNTIEIQ